MCLACWSRRLAATDFLWIFIPVSKAAPQGKFANAGRIRQHAKRVRYPAGDFPRREAT
jgi:hypothetical protein